MELVGLYFGTDMGSGPRTVVDDPRIHASAPGADVEDFGVRRADRGDVDFGTEGQRDGVARSPMGKP